MVCMPSAIVCRRRRWSLLAALRAAPAVHVIPHSDESAVMKTLEGALGGRVTAWSRSPCTKRTVKRSPRFAR